MQTTGIPTSRGLIPVFESMPVALSLVPAAVQSTARPSSRRRRTGRAVLIGTLFAAIVAGGLALKIQSSQALKATTDSIFAQALSAQKAGDTAGAVRDYRSILHLNPINKFAEYDLGTIYQQTGDTTDAYYAYERALLISPSYVPALFNLGVLETASAPAAAAQFYRRVEQLEPSDPRAFFNLGTLYANTDQPVLAQRQFTAAVHLDPALSRSVPTGFGS